ncbi:hypothetical protein [Calothrix sp. UHCC 0171]|uniref:hypothetical protein n=1 Tax=Calothrix sp. UHCC 0171 TaxID=3110245 RepID=UPI002B1EF4E0|nr:hypothetical protein [Calothrix sp. UHCC 0171]MEA5570954.1 hypothetical protein [Calothrix sp. UHCC 0171]
MKTKKIRIWRNFLLLAEIQSNQKHAIARHGTIALLEMVQWMIKICFFKHRFSHNRMTQMISA